MLAIVGFRQRWRNALEVYCYFSRVPRRLRIGWAFRAFARSRALAPLRCGELPASDRGSLAALSFLLPDNLPEAPRRLFLRFPRVSIFLRCVFQKSA